MGVSNPAGGREDVVGKLVEEFVLVLPRPYALALDVEVAYGPDDFYDLQGVVAAHAEFYALEAEGLASRARP